MVSRLSSLALAASVVAALVAMPGGAPRAQSAPAPSGVRLPALGEAEADELGIGDERRLGDQIMREIRRDPDVLDDPVATEYLESIVAPLVAAARQRGDISAEEDAVFAWEPFLVRDRTFNAFALPGGFIGVHLGLIAASASSDEMASVLGHELSHVTQRHIARSMAHNRHQSVMSMLGMLVGILAAARSGNPDVPIAILEGSQAAAVTGQLSYSREMEREADRFGLDVMTSAGFAPSGMASMFERLEAASRLMDNNAYPWLRTHPLTIERLAEARLRVSGTQQVRPELERPVEHQLIRARSRALMDPTEGALRRMQDMGRHAPGLPPPDQLGALYGGAFASILLREFATADAMLESARQAMATATASRVPTNANVVVQAQVAAAPLPAAPASSSSSSSVAVVGAPPGPGAMLSEAASTAVGPPVDIASPHVRRDFALLRLQLAIARRAPAEIAAAASALAREPSRATLITLGDAAVARAIARDPQAPAVLREEIERLQTWVSERKDDALAWSTLALCTEAAGQKLRAIRADAEAHAARGDVVGSIERLRAGQQLARGPGTDFVEGSIIDTRLREMEALRRELQKDNKGRPLE